MRKRTTVPLGGAAALVWLCGLLLAPSPAQGQTATDQTDQTTKSKKKKKSAKATDTEPSSQAAAPAETGKKKTKKAKAQSEAPAGTNAPAETKAKAEEATKPKKSKKSAAEAPSQSFFPPGGSQAGESAPPTSNASAGQIRSAKSSGMVWVNTDSGIYHKGGRWYGATKQGKFMTEDEAIRAGYKAAKNEK